MCDYQITRHLKQLSDVFSGGQCCLSIMADNFTEYLLNITYGGNYSLHGKTEIKQAYLDGRTLKCVTGESCEESCDL
jgi:hypothetical protein